MNGDRQAISCSPPESDSSSAEGLLLEAIVDFVARETSVRRSRIHAHTTLLGDLGIDGDDGWDLMLAFAKSFDVDLGEYQQSIHFGPEGMSPWFPFDWLAYAIRTGPPEQRGLVSITINDLVQAAASKKWRLPAQPVVAADAPKAARR